jgi:prepilin-type N-terminal cleavage/methylation domain-containing protein/prepilin-type processing-associated H-X9-DG protein
MSRRRTRAGFTLIELLVVIAIIAILAAILFPVFARARAQARQAACSSNLQQLALAAEMYSQDFDETLPLWGYGPTGANGQDGPSMGFFSWDTVVFPYMKNQQILMCPDNPYGNPLRGYAMTRYTGDPMGNQTPCSIGDVPAPSATVLFLDKGKQPFGFSGDSACESFYQSHSAAASGGELKDMFHNGGKNFAFLDGHVKFYASGAGPFGQLNNYTGAACPLSGNGVHSAYESHVAGHCEFWPDWPSQ